MGATVVPETGGGRNVRLDLRGGALISLTLAAIVVPLSDGREQRWPVWVFLVLACVPLLAGAFLWYESRLSCPSGMPLVDIALLRIPSFRRGVLVAALFFFTTSFYFLCGLYQQEDRGVPRSVWRRSATCVLTSSGRAAGTEPMRMRFRSRNAP